MQMVIGFIGIVAILLLLYYVCLLMRGDDQV